MPPKINSVPVTFFIIASILVILLKALLKYPEKKAIITENTSTGNAVPKPKIAGSINNDPCFMDKGINAPKNNPADTGQKDNANKQPIGKDHKRAFFSARFCSF